MMNWMRWLVTSYLKFVTTLHHGFDTACLLTYTKRLYQSVYYLQQREPLEALGSICPSLKWKSRTLGETPESCPACPISDHFRHQNTKTPTGSIDRRFPRFTRTAGGDQAPKFQGWILNDFWLHQTHPQLWQRDRKHITGNFSVFKSSRNKKIQIQNISPKNHFISPVSREKSFTDECEMCTVDGRNPATHLSIYKTLQIMR